VKHAIKKAKENQLELELNETYQFMFYANDVTEEEESSSLTCCYR
jgi:hypothetical protein